MIYFTPEFKETFNGNMEKLKKFVDIIIKKTNEGDFKYIYFYIFVGRREFLKITKTHCKRRLYGC